MIFTFSSSISMTIFIQLLNYIGGVVVSVPALSVVDRGLEPGSGQIEGYKIGICCFSAKHATCRRKSKNLLAQIQENMFEWSNIQYLSANCFSELALKIQLSVLVISSNVTVLAMI